MLPKRRRLGGENGIKQVIFRCFLKHVTEGLFIILKVSVPKNRGIVTESNILLFSLIFLSKHTYLFRLAYPQP